MANEIVRIQIREDSAEHEWQDVGNKAGDQSLPVNVSSLTTLYQGSKTVPTGTAEAITTTQTIHSVTVKALSTNTVAIYVGASGVTTANGFELLAGESVSLDVTDLATVFCISGSASQIVRWIAI